MTKGGSRCGAALLLAAACNPDTFGMGGYMPPSPDAGTSTVGEDVTSTAAVETEVADGTGMTGNPTPETAGDGHAMVTISDGPTFDFGGQNVATVSQHTFTVSNQGSGDATSVTVGDPGGNFGLASTDCGSTLAAGASCAVQVSFDPDRFGDYMAQLQLDFDDQGTPASASRMMTGRGVGSTASFIVNGDAESGPAGVPPPQNWTMVAGNTWTANVAEVPAHGGARTLFPGSDFNVTEYVLGQQVHVTPLTTWGTAEGVRFLYRVFHRASSFSNDPSYVRLRFGNESAQNFFVHQSTPYSDTGWFEATHSELAPVGTHYVTLELVCNLSVGGTCNAYFDDIELWAEWP